MPTEQYFDTNVLLDYCEDVFNKFEHINLPSFVPGELDKLKKYGKTEETKYLARLATRCLDENEDKITYIIDETYNLPSYYDKDIMDNRILSVLKKRFGNGNDVIMYSNDILMRQKCKDLGIPYSKFGDDRGSPNHIYKGYKKLSGNTDFVNELFNNIENGINDYGFVTNEYLILDNIDTNKTSEHRYDGNKFVDLKLPNSKVIKGMNSLQRCALDILNNKDISIVAINGEVGSGKSYSCIRMALHHVLDRGTVSKILAVREAIGEGKEIGYLKGTFEDKTKLFFKPIEQSLSGGEFELQALIQRGVLESTIPYYIKGTTYNDTIIVCDESEDLSKKQLKLLGTRLGQNSRIFFAGDYKQSSVDSSERNAMIIMCNELKGKKEFGCIYLDTDVRSETSKIFANLFVK